GRDRNPTRDRRADDARVRRARDQARLDAPRPRRGQRLRRRHRLRPQARHHRDRRRLPLHVRPHRRLRPQADAPYLRQQGAQAGLNREEKAMETNKELLEHYVERYNAGDLDACMELYAEDASQRMHDGVFEGIDAIAERLARDLTAFPDAKYVVDSFFAEG